MRLHSPSSGPPPASERAGDFVGSDDTLRVSEERMRLALEAAQAGLWDWNLRTGIAYLSDEYLRMFGYAPGEVVADLGFMLCLLHPEDRSRTLARLHAQWTTGEALTEYEQRFVCKDGSVKWVLVRAKVAERDADGSALRMVGTATDLTAQKAQEERILRLSRLYRALSKTNGAVARATGFEAMCAEVCRIAVEDGGLVSAVVRMHDPARAALVQVAEHGPRQGAIARTVVDVADRRGLAAAAFNSRRRVLAPDLGRASADGAGFGARDGAILGIRSAGAFPLLADGHPIGTLTVFARDADSLDDEVADLVQEMADALAGARDRLAAVEAVAARERDLELAQQGGRIGSAMIDLASGTWSTSRVGAEILGLAFNGARPLAEFEDMLAPETRDAALAAMRGNLASGTHSDQVYEILRAGERRWIRVITDVEAGNAARRIGTVQDVTSQQLAERRIVQLSKLYAVLSQTHAAVVQAADFAELASVVCRIIVLEAGLSIAVVRLFDAARGVLREVAGYGLRQGLTNRAEIDIRDPVGVAAAAFRRGAPVHIRGIAHDPVTAPAAADAGAVGVLGAAAYPLKRGGTVFGTFTVFAAREEILDEQTSGLIGEIAAALSFAHEKVAAARALAQSEEAYRTLFDASPDAIRVVDGEHIVLVNPAYRRLFGIPEGEAVPREGLFDGVHPDSREAARSRLRRVMTEQLSLPADEQWMLRRDGTRVPVEVTTRPFTYHGRSAALSILRDLSGRREAEARYRSLVETSQSAVLLTEGERIVYANPGTASLLGFEHTADARGASIFDFITPPFAEGVRAHTERLLERPGAVLPPTPLGLKRRDGSLIETVSTGSSVEVAGRLLIQVELRDVTRERRALAQARSLAETLETRVQERTAELSAANAELAAANRDLESFSYSVAHDLRAPLRAMLGFASLLKLDIAEGDTSEAHEHAGRIADSAERMNALVDGLLAVSRVTHGALADVPVDFAAVVRDVVRESHAQCESAFAIPPLPVVMGDAAALRQVWANLLSNAVKYSARSERPAIRIGYRRAGAELVFEVEDNGAGFDPLHAGKLFGVFQRLHAPGEFEGTGVGLAVVRRVVERHGGTVGADSQPGKGATFRFTLPAARLMPRRQT